MGTFWEDFMFYTLRTAGANKLSELGNLLAG